MTSHPLARFKDVCLDAHDAAAMGRFWSAALGLDVADQRLSAGQVTVVQLTGATAEHTVWVNHVTEQGTVKNRVHVDVVTPSLELLIGHGATVVETPPLPWTVLRDPEGGEFCAFVRSDRTAGLWGVVIDCLDAEAVACWWHGLLGGTLGHDDQGHGWWWVHEIPGVPFRGLDFAPVTEPKSVKNRVHLDLMGSAAEVVAAGASVVAERPAWTVLADPEGNEFCVFEDADA